MSAPTEPPDDNSATDSRSAWVYYAIGLAIVAIAAVALWATTRNWGVIVVLVAIAAATAVSVSVMRSGSSRRRAIEPQHKGY